MRAAVCPTGPVPASTVTFLPSNPPKPFSIEAPRVFATAAAAVLYPPLGSTIMLFHHGADFIAVWVASTTFSTISKLLPLMKIFVCAAPRGPRGKSRS